MNIFEKLVSYKLCNKAKTVMVRHLFSFFRYFIIASRDNGKNFCV